MTLPKTLESNEKGTALYKKGKFLGYENVIIISDEELAEETEKATCEDYLAYSSDVIKMPEIWYLLRVFAKKLGYTVK